MDLVANVAKVAEVAEQVEQVEQANVTEVIGKFQVGWACFGEAVSQRIMHLASTIRRLDPVGGEVIPAPYREPDRGLHGRLDLAALWLRTPMPAISCACDLLCLRSPVPAILGSDAHTVFQPDGV